MILRITKHLHILEAERLRQANQTLLEIKRSTHALNFEKKAKYFTLGKEELLDLVTKENFGLFAREKFFPALAKFGNLSYTEVGNPKARVVRNISIRLLFKKFWKNMEEEKLGISLQLGSPLKTSSPEFNFDYLENEQAPDLLGLINFFYDKKVLYVKVFEFLRENQEKLETFFGASATSNLLTLFSANWKLENLQNFEFKNSSLEKILIFKHSSYEDVFNKQKHIGTFYRASESLTLEAKNPIKSVQLLLNKKNEITVDLVLAEENLILDDHVSLTNKNLAKLLNGEYYENLLTENLNTWLKTITSLASCAQGINKELTSKTLLKNF